jgi:hypothetical protein
MATAASDTEENIFGFTLIFFLSLPDSDPFNDAESQKNLGSCQDNSP